MLIECRSVQYWPSVDRVSVGRVSAECRLSDRVSVNMHVGREATDIDQHIGRVSIGCRSVEYWPRVGRVSVGRVLAKCR